MNCARCEKPGVPNKVWRRSSEAEKEVWRRQSVVPIEGRGLCHRCYCWADRAGKLEDYPRKSFKQDAVAARWLALADPSKPISAEARRLAPQFGMHPRALEGAVYRAGFRSQARAVLPNGWDEETLLEEWEMFASPHRSISEESERLAPRFKLKPTTLESAIRRLTTETLRRAS